MSNGQSSKSKSSFHFLAGLASGTCTAVLLQPADLLKTRVQQSCTSSLVATLREIFSSPAPLRQLWRGTAPSAIRTGAGSALYFGSLNMLRTALAKTHAAAAGSTTAKMTTASSALPALSSTGNLATGALARTTAGFLMMPVTVIKVRYESSLYSYRSLAAASADILRGEGFKGFFAGFGATAVRDAPYAGLYVLFYEESKKRLGLLAGGLSPAGDGAAVARRSSASPSSAMSINFASGVLAAGTATAVTNPFDAIKTRIQLMPARYGNMWRAARIMLREEGLRSMFDGLALRMGRKAMSSALAWTVYEELIRRADMRWAEGKGLL